MVATRSLTLRWRGLLRLLLLLRRPTEGRRRRSGLSAVWRYRCTTKAGARHLLVGDRFVEQLRARQPGRRPGKPMFAATSRSGARMLRGSLLSAWLPERLLLLLLYEFLL